MIKSVLIDDETDALEMLEWQLRTHFPDVEAVALCHSADVGIAAIRQHQPQLVFLDIEMPVQNGFEVLRSFPAPDFAVIFTTAYSQFAIKAIKYAAFDYLLKPVDTDDLREALNRFRNKQHRQIDEQFRLLLTQLGTPQQRTTPAHSGRIGLSTAEGMTMVRPDSIVRCQSLSNYTRIFLDGGRQLVVSKTLKEVEETLIGYDFYRVHHSSLINLNHIQAYVKADGGYVVMSDGETISIARNRKDGFMELFDRL